MNRKIEYVLLVFYSVLFLRNPSALAESDTSPLRIQPAVLSLGIFYSGELLKVDGVVPSGSDLAIVCRGERQELKLKKKEKLGGIVWMNRGDVIFKGVPFFYAMHSSRDLGKLAPVSVLKELDITFQDFSIQSTDHPTEKRTKQLFSELIKLKKKGNLFVSNENAIRIDRQGTNREHWSSVIALPSSLLPGKYRISLFGFRNRNGKLLDSKTLLVHQVGLTAFIRSLAKQHGLLYGICAVIIALIVGLLTGIVFGLGSKGGH